MCLCIKAAIYVPRLGLRPHPLSYCSVAPACIPLLHASIPLYPLFYSTTPYSPLLPSQMVTYPFPISSPSLEHRCNPLSDLLPTHCHTQPVLSSPIHKYIISSDAIIFPLLSTLPPSLLYLEPNQVVALTPQTTPLFLSSDRPPQSPFLALSLQAQSFPPSSLNPSQEAAPLPLHSFTPPLYSSPYSLPRSPSPLLLLLSSSLTYCHPAFRHGPVPSSGA